MRNRGKSTLCAAVVAVLLGGGSWVSGALIQETFTYPDGNLVGNDAPVGGAWATHSGAAVGPIQVSDGGITVVQATGFNEDVNLTFEGGVTAGVGMPKLYSAYDLTIDDPGAAVTTQMFAHFLTGTTNFSARTYVTAPTVSGFRLALSNDNSIIDADGEAFTGDLNFGQTYRVVTEYNFDTFNVSRLWVDPVDGFSPSITATDPGFANAVAAYAFRQGGGNTNQVIDNLVVSADPFDVNVPEPASLSMLAIAGLMAFRRRK